jgi:hypothetical protein
MTFKSRGDFCFPDFSFDIPPHIGNIFKEGELDEILVVRNFRIITQYGTIAGKAQETSNDMTSRFV